MLVSFNATAVSGAGAKLVMVSGDQQTAAVGSALPDSLVVRVTDALDNPVAGVEVTWAVGGGGSISPTTVTTDASGLAAAERVLGNASGTQTADASSSGLTPITFTQTAEAANPTALLLISGDAQSGQAGATLPSRSSSAWWTTTGTGSAARRSPGLRPWGAARSIRRT